MKENLKLGFILLLFAAIAGICLGAAYEVTKEPIAQQAIIEKNNAMKEILPDADDFKDLAVQINEDSMIKEVSEAYKGSGIIGYTFTVTPKGFGGLINVMVGISSEGKVSGIKVMSHSETPGLGANAANPKFSDQFKDKPIDKPLEVMKTGAVTENQVDAITGATITSKAVTGGVNEAINFYNTSVKGGQ
ncbi:electron transport complex subunit RnfG [Oxobacter pfennigii]|uniref:Ion-translocating oxidoreductase complex subunit G n=1 Tax=Oxobacter pfennigii TaxID=36849 RepID=A0A0P9AEU0_9CLOT|nr:RnfABCDGE type electron transport complex subunit G [Oxobacter pfennigii]KPU43836.1 electron transport complex subunit RnfG [Oxobacter pfennigii]